MSFYNMPYAHFDKKDKCSKAADFTASAAYQKQYQRYNRREGDGATTEFAYKHDTQEDATFQLVDTSKNQQKNKFGPKKWGQGGRGQGGRGGFGRRDDRPGMGGSQVPYNAGGRGDTGRGGRGGGRFGGGAGRGRGRFNRRDRKMDKLPQLQVEADWEVVQEFDLAGLLKLKANAPVMEDVLWAGHLDAYDETYDKTTTKTAKPLTTFDNRVFFDVTTMEDPVLEKLAVEGVGNVIATDNILSVLMTAPRSVYTWDIVIQKVDGVIYMDKRDTAHLHHPTVSETAHEPPVFVEDLADYNQPDKLASEAYFVNKNFSQQVLRPVTPETAASLRKSFEPDPFFEDDGDSGSEPASVAYRYRKFSMGDINIVARCHLHGWTSKRGEEQLHTSFALNEWDSRFSGGTEWRRKIDQQRGAVLATELKNNSCKLAKWAAESYLSGAHLMKVPS
jgi:translation initiation factor 3 subunit D